MDIESQPPLDHSTLLYETPSELNEAIKSFLLRGLNTNKKCLYVESDPTSPSVIDPLIETHPDLRAAKGSDALSITTAEETYLESGEFDVERTIKLYEDLIGDAITEGFDGLCCIAETGWVLDHNVDIDDWQAYERRINRVFQKHPAMGLCLYDRSQFSQDTLTDVLCSHPKVTDGAGEIPNHYYQPLTESSGQPSDVSELDRKLQSLTSHHTTSQTLRDRKRHFSSLKKTVRQITSSDWDETSQLFGDILTTSLELSIATICIYDEKTGRLTPLSDSESANCFEAVSDPEQFEDLLWEAFAEERAQTFQQTLSKSSQSSQDEPLSVIIQPLGDHGVLVVGDYANWNFSENNREVIKTIAGIIETSLDRHENAQTLEEQRAELEQQNERLIRLERINQVFQNLSEALLSADSKKEVLVAACNEIANTGRVSFAWVGEFDQVRGTLETVDAAGEPDGYLDTIFDEDTEHGREPTRRAAESRESHVVTNIRTGAPSAPWRTKALRRGIQSVISLPLVYDDEMYGILSVYFDEPGVLDTEVRDVLERITGLAAQTINGISRKQAFASEQVSELKLRLYSKSHAALRLTEELDCQYELEGIVPGSDESFRVFATIDAPPDQVLDFASDTHVVDDMQAIAEQDEGALYECTVRGGCFLNVLFEHNAVPRSLTASDGSGHVIIDLPGETRVSDFMETFREKYPKAELEAKSTRYRSLRPQSGFKADIEESLTERQLETVKTAYLSGYFEYPRENSTEDIADMLGVTHPTISRHLRDAQRKVFSEIFED